MCHTLFHFLEVLWPIGAHSAFSGETQDSPQMGAPHVLRRLVVKPASTISTPAPKLKKPPPAIVDLFSKADSLGFTVMPTDNLLKGLGTSMAKKLTSRNGQNVYQTAEYRIDNFPRQAAEQAFSAESQTKSSRKSATLCLPTFQSLNNTIAPLLLKSRYNCAGLTRALRTASEPVIRVIATMLPGAEFKWAQQEGTDRLYCKFMYALVDETGVIHPPKDTERNEIALSEDVVRLMREQTLTDVRALGAMGMPLSSVFWRQLQQEDRALEVEALTLNMQAQAPQPTTSGRKPRRRADVFEVDSIVAERKRGKELLVRWKPGYHPSWEPWRCSGQVGDPVETWEPVASLLNTEALERWNSSQ